MTEHYECAYCESHCEYWSLKQTEQLSDPFLQVIAAVVSDLPFIKATVGRLEIVSTLHCLFFPLHCLLFYSTKTIYR